MGFVAPEECEDKDHVVVGDKIIFSVLVLKDLVDDKVILEVKKIEVSDDGIKTISVSNGE